MNRPRSNVFLSVYMLSMKFVRKRMNHISFNFRISCALLSIILCRLGESKSPAEKSSLSFSSLYLMACFSHCLIVPLAWMVQKEQSATAPILETKNMAAPTRGNKSLGTLNIPV